MAGSQIWDSQVIKKINVWLRWKVIHLGQVNKIASDPNFRVGH